MVYTVKQLSRLASVTVRALHYYEEAHLLEPAYYGTNGYRYYDEKELLRLQQILFFKELGFSIQQIQKVLDRSDFDQLAALHSHRQALQQEWAKIGELLETIDNTIKHIKGKKKMKDREFFSGFSLVTKGKGNESYFAAEELVGKSIKNPGKNNRAKIDQEKLTKALNVIYAQIITCFKQGLAPASDKVQRLIKEHHAFGEQFQNGTKEVYKAYAKLYVEHPEFRKQLDVMHPKLAAFMAEAMNVFADHSLT